MIRITKNSIFTLLATVFIAFAGFSQEDDEIDTERLIIVKPYSPTVSDANKIKQKATINDSLERKKKEVKYNIFSFPVASTFVPDKGRAAGVSTQRPPMSYQNYASLGFGNYSRVEAEFYSNMKLDNNADFNVFFNHNSSQGGIEEVMLDDKYYDTDIELGYASQQNGFNWGTQLGFQHQLFNWYGIPDYHQPTAEVLGAIEPQHSFMSVFLGGDINVHEGVFDQADFKYRRFFDNFESGENLVLFTPKFSFPVGENKIDAEVSFDFVNGDFAKAYETMPYTEKYGFLNMGVLPSYQINTEDVSVTFGAQLVYSLDIQNSDNNMYIYPKFTGSYRLAGDYFIVYGGVEGELRQNSYYNFSQENPFVSPTLAVAPTNSEYDIYLGGKGKFTEQLSYNIRANYLSEKNTPLFVHNPYIESIADKEAYENFNSFGVVYDDMTTFSFFGELQAQVNNDFSMFVNATFNSYSVDNQEEAWNLPSIKGTLGANYKLMGKWNFGLSMFAIGERHVWLDYRSSANTFAVPGKLDGYIDANARIDYQINERLGVFLKGNNLFTEHYRPWLGYPMQSVQVLGGLSYQFDW
ncbi:TonB-dependent receptor [Mesonia sp. K7]|uniref:TonB-dependent receptor n=1 Tax=Mesonia sp. K7 TaxID=2218606 RepID=UPI000DA7841C|nr:TonB-dependent receptor [Mesonia sp. K7]PZD78056.1 TonB-dependent receptor [Mesonia sp. K7]